MQAQLWQVSLLSVTSASHRRLGKGVFTGARSALWQGFRLESEAETIAQREKSLMKKSAQPKAERAYNYSTFSDCSMRFLKSSTVLLFLGAFAAGCNSDNDTCPSGFLDLVWEAETFRLCASGLGAESGRFDSFSPGDPQPMTQFSFRADSGGLERRSDEETNAPLIGPEDAVVTINGAATGTFERNNTMIRITTLDNSYDHFPGIPGSDLTVEITSFPEETGRMVEGTLEGEVINEAAQTREIQGEFEVKLSSLGEDFMPQEDEGQVPFNPWITDPRDPDEVTSVPDLDS
jgi:hypothetical protein